MNLCILSLCHISSIEQLFKYFQSKSLPHYTSSWNTSSIRQHYLMSGSFCGLVQHIRRIGHFQYTQYDLIKERLCPSSLVTIRSWVLVKNVGLSSIKQFQLFQRYQYSLNIVPISQHFPQPGLELMKGLIKIRKINNIYSTFSLPQHSLNISRISTCSQHIFHIRNC